MKSEELAKYDRIRLGNKEKKLSKPTPVMVNPELIAQHFEDKETDCLDVWYIAKVIREKFVRYG